MNQLDYHPTFPSQSGAGPAGQFFDPNSVQRPQSGQAGVNYDHIYATPGSGSATPIQQQFLQQGQQKVAGGPDGMYNASPVQSVGPFSTVSAAQQQASLRQSASPLQPGSPYSTSTPQGLQQVKYPMAAPPLPHTPQQLDATTPTTPQSPAPQSLEQNRIKALLELNIELIQEISSLQTQGKGGATNPQQQAQLKAANQDDKMASEDYIQTMRRVQANLAYLAPRGNMTQANAKIPPGPAHMTPPAHMPQLQAKYDKLKELFPGWTGLDGAQAQRAANGAAAALRSLEVWCIPTLFRSHLSPDLSPSNIMEELKTKNEYLKATNADGLCILEATTTWCSQCKAIAPFVDNLIKQFPAARFYKYDTDDALDISQELGVTHMPTFHIFKDGDLMDSVTGAKAKQLEAAIRKSYSGEILDV